VALLGTAGTGAAQDVADLSARYEKVVAPAGVLTVKGKEAARPLQARAVRSMRASKALLTTFNAEAPGAYPSCAVSLARIRAGAFGVSQGASLVRSASKLTAAAARRARARLGRARVRSGILYVESGLALSGACRAELFAGSAPPLPPPGSGGPGGGGPPVTPP
jgi:hypothetical protein